MPTRSLDENHQNKNESECIFPYLSDLYTILRDIFTRINENFSWGFFGVMLKCNVALKKLHRP